MPTIRKTVGQITLKVLTDVESTTYYYLLVSSMAPAPSAPTTNPPGSGWSTTEPGFFSYVLTQDTVIITGKNYYTRSGSGTEQDPYIYTQVITPVIADIDTYYEKIYGDTKSLYVTVQTLYTDTTFEYSEPSLSSSYEAAKEAYNQAKTALDLAGDTNQYFWILSSAYSTSVPAGVYVTHIPQSQFKSNPAQGNILMQNTGITIRNGAISLASLSSSALNFYSPTTHNVAMQLSGQALKFYNPNNDNLSLSLDSTGLNFYGSSQSTADVTLNSSGLNIAKGSITLGENFIVTNEGVLTAKSGTIGGWTINSSYGIYTNGKTTATSTNTGILIQKDGAIYAGKYNSTNQACPFQVTSDGVLTATSGSIAGWSFNGTSLYKNNAAPGASANAMVISTGTSSDYSIAGSSGIKTWMLSAGTGFGVTTNGTLYATGANISGAITATSLTIDGTDYNSDIKTISSKANSADSNWSVILTVNNINYKTPTATLKATVYHNGAVQTSGFTRAWYKNGTGNSLGSGETLTATDLNAYYVCVVS